MCKKVRIAGTGSFLPDEVYTNEEIVSIVKQKNANWIYKNLGIKECCDEIKCTMGQAFCC